MIVRMAVIMMMGVTILSVVAQESKTTDVVLLKETLIKKMVISEGMELRSLVRNGERSGSREAEESGVGGESI